jgi:hypothetical protein
MFSQIPGEGDTDTTSLWQEREIIFQACFEITMVIAQATDNLHF